MLQGDAALTLYDVKRPVTCAMRCFENSPCSFFSHHEADRVCVLYRPSSTNIRLTQALGYKFFTTDDFPDVARDSQTGQCPTDAVTLHESWMNVTGELTYVSVGPAGVWGVNGAGKVFYRDGTYGNPSAAGRKWQRVFLSDMVVQADVGSDSMYCVGSFLDVLWYRLGISSSVPYGDANGGQLSWVHAYDQRTWASVSPAGSVWAVDTSGQLLHARDSASRLNTGTEWDVMAPDMRRVDAGRAGVWALDNAGRLHYRRGTYGDDGGTSTGTEWVTLGGELSGVSSGTSLVVVVTSAGCVWVRVGLSADTPAGLGWALHLGVMKQAEVYEDGPVAGLWAVDFSDNIYLSVLDKETGL